MKRIVATILVGVLVIGFRFPVQASVSDQHINQSGFQPLVCMEQLPKSLLEFTLLTSMGDAVIYKTPFEELESLSRIVEAVEMMISPYKVMQDQLQTERDALHTDANTALNRENSSEGNKYSHEFDRDRDCSTIIWSVMLIYATWRLHGRHTAKKDLHDPECCKQQKDE